MAEMGLNLQKAWLSSCSKGLLSSCGVRASYCGELSCCRAGTPGMQASVVVVLWLILPMACGISPSPGTKPCSRMGKRFVTTEYSGKSNSERLKPPLLVCCCLFLPSVFKMYAHMLRYLCLGAYLQMYILSCWINPFSFGFNLFYLI